MSQAMDRKRMTADQVSRLLDTLKPRFIEEAEEALADGIVKSPAEGRKHRLSSFLNSGWFAACVCAVVGIGVYVGLLGAGKGWFGTPAGHSGTSWTEAVSEPDGSEHEAKTEAGYTQYTALLQDLLARGLSGAAADDETVRSFVSVRADCTDTEGNTVSKSLCAVTTDREAALDYDAGPGHKYSYTLSGGVLYRHYADYDGDQTVYRYEPDESQYDELMAAIGALGLAVSDNDFPGLVCTGLVPITGMTGSSSVSQALTEQLLLLTGLSEWGVEAQDCTATAQFNVSGLRSQSDVAAFRADDRASLESALTGFGIRVTITTGSGIGAEIRLSIPSGRFSADVPKSSRLAESDDLMSMIRDAYRPGPSPADKEETDVLSEVDVMSGNIAATDPLCFEVQINGTNSWESPFLTENFLLPMTITQSTDSGDLVRRIESRYGSITVTLYDSTLYVEVLFVENMIDRPADERYCCPLTDAEADEIRRVFSVASFLPTRADLELSSVTASLQDKSIRCSGNTSCEPRFIGGLLTLCGLPVEMDPASYNSYSYATARFSIGPLPKNIHATAIYSKGGGRISVEIDAYIRSSTIDGKPITAPADADAFERLSYQETVSRLNARYPVFGYGADDAS